MAEDSPATDQRTGEEARQRILSRTREHFFAHGFRRVTMDDLAAELGMSKKTLYVHFPSKAALLEAVLQDKLRRADETLGKALEVEGFEAQFQSLLVAVREIGEEIQPPFVRDMQREEPALFGIVMEGRAKLIQTHFGRLIGAGQKTGEIRNDIPTEVLIDMMIGAMNAVGRPTRVMELGLTPKAMFALVISLFLDGMRTSKGNAK